MKAQFSAIFFLLLSTCLFGQNAKSQIEINPYLRWDSYPKFSYAINSINSYSLKIHGTSWGINAAYKHPFHNMLYIKAGLGYYRYSFNKIESYNPSYGVGHARIINYIGLGDVIFATNKYWYNTISASIGIEHQFFLKNSTQGLFGLDINNYYTYSQ